MVCDPQPDLDCLGWLVRPASRAVSHPNLLHHDSALPTHSDPCSHAPSRTSKTHLWHLGSRDRGADKRGVSGPPDPAPAMSLQECMRVLAPLRVVPCADKGGSYTRRNITRPSGSGTTSPTSRGSGPWRFRTWSTSPPRPRRWPCPRTNARRALARPCTTITGACSVTSVAPTAFGVRQHWACVHEGDFQQRHPKQRTRQTAENGGAKTVRTASRRSACPRSARPFAYRHAPRGVTEE